MKKRAVLIVAAVVLLMTALLVTAMAAGNTTAVTDLNDVSAYAKEHMSSLFVNTDHVKTYCPICDKEVDWYALETPMRDACPLDPTYHWFLKKDIAHTGKGFFQVLSGNSICLYLNGKSLSSEYVAFGVYGTLNLIDNGPEGQGVVSGSNYGKYANIGATIDLGGGTLNLFGGTYTKTATTNPGPVIGFTGKATLNIYDGTVISGGKNTAEGGNIGIYSSGATLNMYGGTVTGGNASSGGNIASTVADSSINIYGGTVTNGTAVSKGGNLYSKAPLNIYGGTISDGVGPTGGGNIFTVAGVQLNIGTANGTQVLISGGESRTGQGGSIACGGDTVIQNARISGGNSGTVWGGNLYIDTYSLTLGAGTILENGNGSAGGNLMAYSANLTFDGVTFTGGISNNTGKEKGGGNLHLYSCNVEATNTVIRGGTNDNVYLRGTSSCKFTDCTIADGTTKDAGGNIYVHSGAMTLTNCTVSGGKATSGGNIYNAGDLTLNNCTVATTDSNIFNDNNITVNGGQVTGTLYVRMGRLTLDGNAGIDDLQLDMRNVALAAMHVKKGFTGDVVIKQIASNPVAPYYGVQMNSAYTAEGDFTGKLILNDTEGKPGLFHRDGGLAVCTARTQKGSAVTWYKDNAAAVAAYGDADLLIPAAGDLVLTGGSYTVDLAGRDISVTGTGNVTFLDSANRNHKDYGKVSVNGPKVCNTFATEVGDETYCMLENSGKLSFHLLDLQISSVSIRPADAGIYFGTTWACDDLMKETIQSFGVAVSLMHQPGADFAQDKQTLYTQFKPDSLQAGAAGTSVLITNILRADKTDNVNRGQMPIYATAYMTLSDGTSQTTVLSRGGLSRSLRDMMEQLDTDYALYSKNKTAVDSFCNTWKSTMDAWNLKRVGSSISDGKTLKLLAITSSFGVNTTEALYDIAKSEGATDVTVARLYASGCTMQQHAQNAKSGEGAYQYSKISDASGGVWSTQNKTSMLTGLLDEQWDIIFIQQSAYEANQADYINEVLDFVKANKPENAKVIWNMTWAFAKDSDQAKFHNVFHGDQNYMYEQIRNLARDTISVRTDVDAVIPTGTAVQNVRTSYIGHTLTKDTYHLNNMGRVIAGYTLWGTITGKPLTQIKLDTFASGWDQSDGMGTAVTLSAKDKQVILESVNAALADPYQITKSSYPAEKDDVLRILMIGNSYCFYHVEELYSLLAADGIKAQVCNVYYSGCPMVSHYNWWVDGLAKYEYYVTDENGRRQPAGRLVSLEYCLGQEDWDVISIQESLFKNYPFDNAEQILANNQRYRDALIPYIQQRFPNADMYWRQNWSAEIGFVRNDLTITAEIQKSFEAKEEAAGKAIAAEYGIKRVNNSTAWAIARQSDLVWDLCDRNDADVTESDKYHDGNVGGGQYLNACLWYEILTGNSCVGKEFDAEYLGYELSAELVAVLQNAAHQAAQELLK